MWLGVCKELDLKTRETSFFVYHQEKAHLLFKNKRLEKLRPAEPTGHCRPTSSVTSAYLNKHY